MPLKHHLNLSFALKFIELNLIDSATSGANQISFKLLIGQLWTYGNSLDLMLDLPALLFLTDDLAWVLQLAQISPVKDFQLILLDLDKAKHSIFATRNQKLILQISLETTHSRRMHSQLIRHLEVQPKIDHAWFATRGNVLVDPSNAEVVCIWLRVKITIHEAVSSQLPVAEMQLSASHKLQVVSLGWYGANVSDNPVARVDQSAPADCRLGLPIQ